MTYGTNPYYNPEEYEAAIVGEVEWSEPCWSFDTTVVWKDKDGFFRMDSDSGCSCPSPFEDTRWDELERLSNHEVAAALNERLDNTSNEYYNNHDYAAPQVVELISRVMK